ncbi:MAG: hypothetical protein D6718_01720 [Acidobacteria bacterium]|nr:MAG: hypothetical protein D6718_01720 [Acidobacteriota bacterium]
MRRTAFRLGVLILLLLAYPLGALILSRFAPPGPQPPPGRVRVTALQRESGEVRFHLRVDNLSDRPFRVERIALLLLDARDRPAITWIEESAALRDRLGDDETVPPGSTREIGRFALPVPSAIDAPVLSVAVAVLREGDRRPATLEADQPLTSPR